jgi:hypothetical protein
MNNNITKAISDYGDAMLKAGKAREVLDRSMADWLEGLRGNNPNADSEFRNDGIRSDFFGMDESKDTTGVDDTNDSGLCQIQFKIERGEDLTTKEAIAWDKHLNSMKAKPTAEEIEADVEPERKFTLVTAEYLVLKYSSSEALTLEEMMAWSDLADDCNSDDMIKVYAPEGEG